MTTFVIKPEHQTPEQFESLVRQCDAVWPVAPEFDSILKILCQQVVSLNKLLLTSPAPAVAMTGNKWLTFQQLTRHKIATVDTRLFEGSCYSSGEWMVKPVDGAGCNDSYLITSQQGFVSLSKQLSGHCQFIIQPHLQGQKISLSCLFKQGRGWLLCANLQGFELIDNQYHLLQIDVNHNSDVNRYLELVKAIAKAFPELWGYAGIDLIETTEEIKVLEINPRLTTSFVGIQAAKGINTCQGVLDLLEGDPLLDPQCNKSVAIRIKQENHDI
jgi:predicted ATP-grasp superfamily ATP-dependent carboligase